MILFKQAGLIILLVGAAVCAQPAPTPGGTQAGEAQEVVQAEIVLTVSEGKRLIAKAVPEVPVVKNALEHGTVIICKGTTNTYVAEEILGERIPHGAYVYGRTYPAEGGKRLERAESIGEIVLVKGKRQADLSLAAAVEQLEPGDVVMKGANALDYERQTAGVFTGPPAGGTSGTIMPYVIARKAHLVIPVGLEKQVAGPVFDLANKMREPCREPD